MLLFRFEKNLDYLKKKTTHLVYLGLKKQFFSFFKKETRFCYFFKENGKTLFITL